MLNPDTYSSAFLFLLHLVTHVVQGRLKISIFDGLYKYRSLHLQT